ncbi:MAG: Arc family DNA-binding protein [Psychrosphaera sp.]|nr:Arc family DNA-binding protein [Psychrosphaera sp.]
MPSITVKNVPSRLYDKLKRAAEANRRSINDELIACLEKVFEPKSNSSQQHILAARNIRHRLDGFTVSDEDLKRAKEDGRA